MSPIERFQVVVVGAGFAGLAAAKEYIQCAPDTNLLIIDEHNTVGGVWSKDKIYDGLRANNHRGTFELPDYPFPDRLGISHGEHVTGEALSQYLTEYAEKFDIARRIRFRTRVVEVEKLSNENNSGWKVLIDTGDKQHTLVTDKLIVATGLTSRPRQLYITGQDGYNAPIVHAAQLPMIAPSIAKDAELERITVLGGSKYAWDCVYRFAAAGKEIDWIIRKSGYGPIWIANNIAKLPVLGNVWAERLVTTRFVTWLSPCVWGGLDGSAWWRRFLHGTWLGRKVVQGFWDSMGHAMLEQAGFLNHPSLESLLPDCGIFDAAPSFFAVMNHPTDILDFVRSGQVKVHREDISYLSDRTVHLATGEALRSDAFLASLGWIPGPTMIFKDEDIHSDLGLPSVHYTDEQKAFWADLDRQADAQLFTQFPMLATRPSPPRFHKDVPVKRIEEDLTPQRLYRFTASPGLAARGDRTLAFAGYGSNISHTMKAELVGLWIYAFFNDKLDFDPARDMTTKQVYQETALMQRWSAARHTYGFGKQYQDHIWDALPWTDVLMKDLGLPWMRKGWFWREWFEPYTHADFRGITDEWLAKRKKEN